MDRRLKLPFDLDRAGKKPLEPDFLNSYTTARKALEDASDAEDFLPEFTSLSSQLRAAKWGVARPRWQFERPAPPGTIDILDATYGKSCGRFLPRAPAVNTFHEGNAPVALNGSCRGLAKCDFQISARRLGDPAQGCGKDFFVTYRCNPGEAPIELTVPAEADGRSVTLECPYNAGFGISVIRQATVEAVVTFDRPRLWSTRIWRATPLTWQNRLVTERRTASLL